MNNDLKSSQTHNVYAEIYFYPTEKGGRETPVLNKFRCPMVINEEMFDCVLLLLEVEKVKPGGTAKVSIEFLSSQIVIPMLHVGKKFFLWERGIIAEGEIRKIISKSSSENDSV